MRLVNRQDQGVVPKGSEKPGKELLSQQRHCASEFPQPKLFIPEAVYPGRGLISLQLIPGLPVLIILHFRHPSL